MELGSETYQAQAVTVDEPDRSRFYAEIAARIDSFADYQRRTDRVIPVVELQRNEWNV